MNFLVEYLLFGLAYLLIDIIVCAIFEDKDAPYGDNIFAVLLAFIFIVIAWPLVVMNRITKSDKGKS